MENESIKENMVEVKNYSLEKFRILHSKIIEYYQCIEYDMRRIYAAMCDADFEECLDEIYEKNWGVILNELRKLDHSDNNPYFSEDDYKLLDEIRIRRNYWCHQCYIDFDYIQNNREREERLQRLTRQLENEHNRAAKLHKKMQDHFLEVYREFN